jgi:hypothetical protein
MKNVEIWNLTMSIIKALDNVEVRRKIENSVEQVKILRKNYRLLNPYFQKISETIRDMEEEKLDVIKEQKPEVVAVEIQKSELEKARFFESESNFDVSQIQKIKEKDGDFFMEKMNAHEGFIFEEFLIERK